jgi:hypothetical protein
MEEELQSARGVLMPTMKEEELEQRFREVGGVPRHIFEPNPKQHEMCCKLQDTAVQDLGERVAWHIALNDLMLETQCCRVLSSGLNPRI